MKEARHLVMPRESGWYFLPALASTWFIIVSALGGSSLSLVLNVLMLLLALVSFFRPTVFAWSYLMVGSLVYLFECLSFLEHSWHGSPTLGQWVFVTVLGVFPTVSLWWHRPRAVAQTSLAALLRETGP
jgi:hypothetical protein